MLVGSLESFVEWVRMDLNHISAFVRVVQDGSFTAAAKALSLPKSSVSRSIAHLEADLGVRLLHRTTRKLSLTDAGTAFHQRVSRALADIDEATTAAADLQRDLRGPIRITAPVDLGVWAVARLVARFVRKHPHVKIEFHLTSRVVDVGAEGFDLALRAGTIRDESVVARRVGAIELGLNASAHYVARRGMPKTLADLANHECVVLKTNDETVPWKLASASGEEVLVEPRGAISADDMSFMKKAVLAGGGIALLPRFLTVREEDAGKLVRVLPEWRLSSSVLHVVYPSARYIPQRVATLRDYLVRELTKLFTRCDERIEVSRRKASAA
jgi:DNA-binding transcriptional LysR family regulator